MCIGIDTKCQELFARQNQGAQRMKLAERAVGRNGNFCVVFIPDLEIDNPIRRTNCIELV